MEREFSLGLGGLSRLDPEDQARLIAYRRVKDDPAGKTKRRKKKRTVQDALRGR